MLGARHAAGAHGGCMGVLRELTFLGSVEVEPLTVDEIGEVVRTLVFAIAFDVTALGNEPEGARVWVLGNRSSLELVELSV